MVEKRKEEWKDIGVIVFLVPLSHKPSIKPLVRNKVHLK